MDVEAVEAAAKSIDAFIERRARQSEEQRRVEAEWAISERRHRERRREENREAWRSYYLDQAERLERTAAELAAKHRARAEELAGEGAA